MAVDTARISAQAREVQFRRAFLLALAGMLYAAGWAARKIFQAVWLVAAWSWTAVRLGWQEAKKT